MLIFALLFVPLWAARLVHQELQDDGLAPGRYFYGWSTDGNKAKLFKGLGCYCKEVTSLDECPESKPGDEDLTNPSYYRFYHAAPNGEPVSCCKLAWTSIFDAKGWKYKRQKSMELCTYDRRPLPEDVCCRPSYEAGLHLRSVGKFSGQRIRGIRDEKKEFIMSKLFFDLEDVLGGEDYNGTQLEASQVQEFVAWKRKFVDWRGWSPENYNGRDDNALWCLQGSQKLLADTGKCTIRSGPVVDCCCHEAALDEKQYCFPTPGIPAGPVVVTGNYTEYERYFKYDGYFKQGKMEWDESLLQPKGLKKQISAFDPENEKMYFEWMAVWDWDWECIEGKSIPDIQQAFNDHLNLRRFQTTRTVCSKRKYTRRVCPADQWLYKKMIPKGQCLKEPLESTHVKGVLVDMGGLNFQCPEHYKGSNPGPKYHPKCECDNDCKAD